MWFILAKDAKSCKKSLDAFSLGQFDGFGVPEDLGGASELSQADKHQFQLFGLFLTVCSRSKAGVMAPMTASAAILTLEDPTTAMQREARRGFSRKPGAREV